MTALAIEIQTKAMDLLQAGFGTRFKTYRYTPMLQVTPDDLPVCGVYILRERHLPHGSYNHAEPKFDSELTLGLSGGVHVETDEQNQIPQLERMMGQMLEVLLTDPKFVILSEGITSMDRVGQFAKVGETTLYEIRIEMQMRYWTSYPPNVPDILERVVVDTQFPDAAHAESGTPQIHREYDLPVE